MKNSKIVCILKGEPKSFRSNLFLLLVTFLLLLFATCKKPKPPLDLKAPKTHYFNVMEQKLKEKIGPHCVGMGFTVVQNGVERAKGSTGSRLLSSNTGDSAWNYLTTTRQTIFSTSKTITAAATMAWLNFSGITPNTPIKPYFPTSWDVSSVSENVTFAHLMRHRSGFVGTRDAYDNMKNYIEIGNYSTFDSFVYANVNYTLLRVLLPMLKPQVRENVNIMDESEDIDILLSNEFVSMVQMIGMNVSGMSSAAGPYIWDTNNKREGTRLYDFQNQNVPGCYILTGNNCELNDFKRLCGAGGWYLNTIEMAHYIDRLLRDNLVSPGIIDVATMKSQRFGMFRFINNTPGVGNYYTHNGSAGTAIGGRSVWLYLEDFKITVVLFINSANNGGELSNFPANMNIILDAISESYF